MSMVIEAMATNPKRLYIVIPGLGGRIHHPQWIRFMEEMRRRLGGTWVGIDHYARPWHRPPAISIARAISTQIADLASDHDEIVLVGHSLGGLLARAAYLLAAGALAGESMTVVQPAGAGAPAARAWSEKVIRFVLLASLDAGFNPRSSSRRSRLYRLAKWPFRWLGLRLVSDLVRNSDFITNVRLSWIRHLANGSVAERLVVAQILGTKDEEVDHQDSLDPAQFPRALRLDVLGADHVHLHDFSFTPEPFRHANLVEMAFRALPAARPPVKNEDEPSDIVIALHGIRAHSRSWPARLASAMQSMPPSWPVITPDYGYFTALRFALPFLRAKPMNWFLQNYTDLVLRYPRARFHFVAHSNGTYLVGHAMLRVPAVRCESCYFGGSVLPQNFDWPLLRDRGQVTDRVFNAQCFGDFVVGILCRFINWYLLDRTVGVAGTLGFSRLVHTNTQILVQGGHSAAFPEGKPSRDADAAANQARLSALDSRGRKNGRPDDKDTGGGKRSDPLEALENARGIQRIVKALRTGGHFLDEPDSQQTTRQRLIVACGAFLLLVFLFSMLYFLPGMGKVCFLVALVILLHLL